MSEQFNHADTIGVIEWREKTYEIDWPFEINDESKRNEMFGAIYLNGTQVGECCKQDFTPFTDANEVLREARAVIESGEVNE